MPKIILAQPANKRFEWEVDVVLHNIRQFLPDTTIILSFLEEDPTVLEHFQGRDWVEVHHYPDYRAKKDYHPTIKPYLIWRYLEQFPTRDACLFIDSDIIFREMVDFSKMPIDEKVAWGSDCDGYIGYEYLETRENGQQVLDTMARVSGLSVEEISAIPGAGAQWYMKSPTAELFREIYEMSQAIWDATMPINTNLQKWTAEMWAQIYGLHKHGWEVKMTPELKFCWPTDSIDMWDHSKILHNSGVVGESAAGLFFKGKYQHYPPFDEDLSWVRKDRCSWHYVQAIEAAKKSV